MAANKTFSSTLSGTIEQKYLTQKFNMFYCEMIYTVGLISRVSWLLHAYGMEYWSHDKFFCEFHLTVENTKPMKIGLRIQI